MHSGQEYHGSYVIPFLAHYIKDYVIIVSLFPGGINSDHLIKVTYQLIMFLSFSFFILKNS